MDGQELAIMFSGGTDSLALYAMAMSGRDPGLPKARRIHLLHMLNGMSRFHDFPRKRFELSRKLITNQVVSPDDLPESHYVELDMGRLFQGLWLDWYEELMPRYGGKNLVCVACKLAMHARAVIYCADNFVPLLVTGYTKKQAYYPEQTAVFMEKIAGFAADFGVKTSFPVYEEFDEQSVTRHVLEDFGLPSTGGGERKCLFCQTLTTVTDQEIAKYLDDMIPRVSDYVNHKLSGRVKEAAGCFPPGR
ncbi:MAG: hypothetical protein KKB30_09405 [Proteobacteria bacterium]|nr:hypothetical protein [Pseudomonadota bacterium]MBU1716938.1 hypothetical protein [Pseudomonadota bacterium]